MILFIFSDSHVPFVLGDNGTVDGQGAVWWEKFKEKKLKKERPYLIEIMYSDQVQISNITLINSPQWHVHPIYSRFDPFTVLNLV